MPSMREYIEFDYSWLGWLQLLGGCYMAKISCQRIVLYDWFMTLPAIVQYILDFHSAISFTSHTQASSRVVDEIFLNWNGYPISNKTTEPWKNILWNGGEG